MINVLINGSIQSLEPFGQNNIKIKTRHGKKGTFKDYDQENKWTLNTCSYK